MRLRTTVAIAAMLATLTPAIAHEGEVQCRRLGGLAPICDRVGQLEDGLARSGVSYADLTDDPILVIDVRDFSFAPRVFQIFDGQRVVFRNGNPKGGNRHSLASSDLGGADPILPLPGSGFGGGRAFRSGLLQPGESFILDVNIPTMDPEAYMPTGLGDHIIGFHCYVHGASQMNGYIRVLPRV
jgi:hypothetical protein